MFSNMSVPRFHLLVICYLFYLYYNDIMNSKLDVELLHFYIFNSTFGLKEGEEHKKILYYYPFGVDTESQIKQVGFAEAIIQFTGSFRPTSECSSLHTQKTRQLYFQPEKKFWMVMTLSVPYICKTKEGAEYCEYQGDDIQDNVYQSVLRQAYSMYRLFSGTFHSVIASSDIFALKHKLEHFFTAYLKTLKLTHCDILNVFNGIQFLPLDKIKFLNVQCFINLLECNFPYIRYTSFLYNDHLIWSGIEPGDMQTVYQYLVSTLLPAHMETELHGGSMPRHNPSPFSTIHYGRFITGPVNLKESTSIGKVPRIYINNDTQPSSYYLVVYRSLSSSVCLFIDGAKELTMDVFRELDAFMGPQLTTVVSSIAEYCSQQSNSTANSFDSNNPKFIYFNKLNLAYKSTVHLDNRQSGNVAVSQEVLKIMADMNSNRQGVTFTGETIVKTMNDYWVVRKLSNLREFYIAIQQKNASLGDISDEVKKLCETELKGIFFHPT
ncbi:Caffeine calcium zinc sensitivity 1 [Carabus blaptoides fortunei]